MNHNTRSQRYQWRILEVPFDSDLLSSYSNQAGLSHSFNPYVYNEALLDLRERLLKRLIDLGKTRLTFKQWMYIDLYFLQDKTQTEISKELGVLQNCISRSIAGTSKGKFRHGGSLKKLRALALKDPEVVSLLAQIEELATEKE